MSALGRVFGSNDRREQAGRRSRGHHEPGPGEPLEHEHRRHHVHDPVPCPPPLVVRPTSDRITRSFRHVIHTIDGQQALRAPVEVVVRTRIERTSGAYLVGDLVHTMTLLPGEEVRIFTTDRRTRFSYEKDTDIAYRTQSVFEDQMYLSAMDSFFGRLSANSWAEGSASTQGQFESHGEVSNWFENIFSDPSGDVNGSFSMDSFASFTSGLAAQASAAHHQSVAATAAASAVSIGAVGIQDKFKAELQDRFELNCRHFRNPSRTHTTTFYFYQIRRMHTVEFAIEAIELPPVDRLLYRAKKKEKAISDFAEYADHVAARSVVQDDLVARGLARLDHGELQLGDAIRPRSTFRHEFSLPTPGLVVRGNREGRTLADPSVFRELTELGGEVVDRAEELGTAIVERIGDAVLPVIVRGTALVKAFLPGVP